MKFGDLDAIAWLNANVPGLLLFSLPHLASDRVLMSDRFFDAEAIAWGS